MCSTYYGGTGVLTASVPNMVVFGVMESRNIPIFWGEWGLYLFPVIGLLRVGCCYLLIRLLLPVRPPPVLAAIPTDTPQIPAAVTPAEKKTVGILLLGTLCWASDAFHGIHPRHHRPRPGSPVLPARLGGPLSPDRLKGVNFPILIYIAAVFAMGYALEKTGFNTHLAGILTGWLDLSEANTLFKLGAITCLTVPFDFLADTAAIAGVLTPFLLDFGASIGLPPLPTALSVAIGTSLVCIPYQSAPLGARLQFPLRPHGAVYPHHDPHLHPHTSPPAPSQPPLLAPHRPLLKSLTLDNIEPAEYHLIPVQN